MNLKTTDAIYTRLAEAMYPTVMQALSGQEPDTATTAAKRHARSVTRNLVFALKGEGIVHDLKKAIGGLRSIAYGDAQTWPNCSSREVAKRALLDCGGEKYERQAMKD